MVFDNSFDYQLLLNLMVNIFLPCVLYVYFCKLNKIAVNLITVKVLKISLDKNAENGIILMFFFFVVTEDYSLIRLPIYYQHWAISFIFFYPFLSLEILYIETFN